MLAMPGVASARVVRLATPSTSVAVPNTAPPLWNVTRPVAAGFALSATSVPAPSRNSSPDTPEPGA
ncbi:hypothetical protein ACAN107058_14650 [Paracidovorax anthurii]